MADDNKMAATEVETLGQKSLRVKPKAGKVLGIELAPLNIPLHRRLETMAVSHFAFCFLVLGVLCVLTPILLLFTRLYWVTLLLAAWSIYDRERPRKGGRPSKWCRTWRLWTYMANYFPARLHKSVDLDPTRNYLMAFHPHGIMSMGAFVNFSTEATGFSKLFPGITSHLTTLAGTFNLPLGREYMFAVGLCDVSKESIDWILSHMGVGHAAVIVVGGAKESLESNPEIHRLYLSQRKGFVRRAVRNGSDLVPIYSFGESDIYDQVPSPQGSKLRTIQTLLTKVFGFAPAVFKGRGFFNYTIGVLPYRRPINSVVGRPLPVKQILEPTEDQIDEVHRLYIDRLRETFDEHKAKFGIGKDQYLEII